MRKTALVIILALGLGACDWQTTKAVFTGTQNPVTARNLYEANLAYDGALKAFNAMRDLCARRVIPNSCRTYVIQGQKVIPKAEIARKTANNFVKNNPTLDATSVVNIYISLVGALQKSAAQTP